MTNVIFLALGSNLGNRQELLEKALQLLEQRVGTLIRCSSFHETEAVGFQSENLFLNAVACFETECTPRELLTRTQEIERELGRTSKSVEGIYHDRLIDIDILLYNDWHIEEPDLKVPHPKMFERPFVMEPLKEIFSFSSEVCRNFPPFLGFPFV